MPDEWYYTQDGRGRGPVSEAQLEELITKGQLRPNDILWQEGMTQKIKVETVLAELERRGETPAEAPGPAETPEPLAPKPAGVPDWLPDVAAEPVRPAGGTPPAREPAVTPRDWLDDVRKGIPPPRRAAPAPAAAAPAAEAGQQAPPEQAPAVGADVELVPAGSDLTPAPAPQEPAPERPAPFAAEPRGKAPTNLSLLGSFVLSACALVLSLVALGLHFFADPLGPGLARYDFTTPRAALVSQMQIQRRHDVRAALELQALTAGGNLQEKLNTLEVPKEADWNGVHILFISYREDGVKRYGTAGFEKNARTGLWAPAPVPLPAVREQDPELAKQIESWEKDGHF
jgi:hypothetical protein